MPVRLRPTKTMGRSCIRRRIYLICRSLFWGSPLGRTGHRSVADGWTDAGRQPVNQPAAARTGILRAGEAPRKSWVSRGGRTHFSDATCDRQRMDGPRLNRFPVVSQNS